jgi:hypothetical protein
MELWNLVFQPTQPFHHGLDLRDPEVVGQELKTTWDGMGGFFLGGVA